MALVLAGLQFPWWAQSLFFSFWALAFILDIKITISCENFIKYETNFLFRFFVRKFGPRRSIPLQVLAETGLLVLSSYTLDFQFGVQSMSLVSMVFGLAHVAAWRSNRRFLKKPGLHEGFS
ncbi:MAG: hypothetical protein ACREBA_01315 [Nitrosotalea sp.]